MSDPEQAGRVQGEIMVCGCCGQAMGHAPHCAKVITLNPQPDRDKISLTEYRTRQDRRG